jgi:hypothetical protein
MKSRTVKIPIFFGKFTMIFTDDLSKVNTLYNTKIDDNLYDAVVFEPIGTDEYIVAIKKVDWSIIAHEVVHLVNALFISCGIELDRHNDEPQAYITGWFINEIDSFIKSHEFTQELIKTIKE